MDAAVAVTVAAVIVVITIITRNADYQAARIIRIFQIIQTHVQGNMIVILIIIKE